MYLSLGTIHFKHNKIILNKKLFLKAIHKFSLLKKIVIYICLYKTYIIKVLFFKKILKILF